MFTLCISTIEGFNSMIASSRVASICEHEGHNLLSTQILARKSPLQTFRPAAKGGCNRGHSLSAAIKLGSLEKTVGASLIAL